MRYGAGSEAFGRDVVRIMVGLATTSDAGVILQTAMQELVCALFQAADVLGLGWRTIFKLHDLSNSSLSFFSIHMFLPTFRPLKYLGLF